MISVGDAEQDVGVGGEVLGCGVGGGGGGGGFSTQVLYSFLSHTAHNILYYQNHANSNNLFPHTLQQ